jgi:membrane protease YdiL (CAAX protease family)
MKNENILMTNKDSHNDDMASRENTATVADYEARIADLQRRFEAGELKPDDYSTQRAALVAQKQELRRNKSYKVYPSFIDAVAICLIFLLAFTFAGMVSDIFGGSATVSAIADAGTRVVVFAVIFWFVRRNKRFLFRPAFRFGKVSSASVIASLSFAIGWIAVILLISVTIDRLVPTPSWMREASTGIVLPPVAVSVICSALIPAVTEEMLCRGLFLRGFAKNYSRRTAVVLSALLFAVLHFNIQQGTNAFLMGLFLGWIYLNTQSLVPCILIHFVYNGALIVLMKYLADVTYRQLFGRYAVAFYAVIVVTSLALITGMVIFAVSFKRNRLPDEELASQMPGGIADETKVA